MFAACLAKRLLQSNTPVQANRHLRLKQLRDAMGTTPHATDMNTPEEVDAEVRESWRARVAGVTKDSVNEKDRDGRGWLSNAIVWIPEVDVLKGLLNLGADVNAADQRRWTPLHFAAQERHAEIAKLLIQNGAAVDPVDKFGNTPLGNATYGQGGLEVMRILMEAGADPKRKNEYGSSPMDQATQTGDTEKLAILQIVAEPPAVASVVLEEPAPVEQVIPAPVEETPVASDREPAEVQLVGHEVDDEQPLTPIPTDFPPVEEAEKDFSEPAIDESSFAAEEPNIVHDASGSDLTDKDDREPSTQPEIELPDAEEAPPIPDDADADEHEPSEQPEDEMENTPEASMLSEDAPELAPTHEAQPESIGTEGEEPVFKLDTPEIEAYEPEPANRAEEYPSFKPEEEPSPEVVATEVAEMLAAANLGAAPEKTQAELPPTGPEPPPMPFDQFEKRFTLDPDGGQRTPITAAMPNTDLKDLLNRFAGASFNNGLYRIIDAQTVVQANAFIASAVPEHVGKLCPFGFDWAGNIFAVDPRNPEADVVHYDLGTSDVATMPFTVLAFHDLHLLQDAEDGILSSNRYNQWLANGGQAPRYAQCVEYKVPLFLNGSPDLQNMAITDLEVYWHLTAQLINQARALNPGTRIGSVTMGD